MTFFSAFTLFGVLVVLAMIPSGSVALVVARSLSSGVRSGIAVAFGIVLGDLLFILFAICGLSVIAETLGGLFIIVRFLGATYLLWLGFALLSHQGGKGIRPDKPRGKGDLLASFLAGFLLTLGDAKALFFYASLFPELLDLKTLNAMDLSVIVAITVVGVGGAKLAYAVLADRIVSHANRYRVEGSLRRVAGGLMVGVGGYLIVKT